MFSHQTQIPMSFHRSYSLSVAAISRNTSGAIQDSTTSSKQVDKLHRAHSWPSKQSSGPRKISLRQSETQIIPSDRSGKHESTSMTISCKVSSISSDSVFSNSRSLPSTRTIDEGPYSTLKQCNSQYTAVMNELMETETLFVKNLKMLRDVVIRFYLDRCKAQGCRCSPLETLEVLTTTLIGAHSKLLGLKDTDLLQKITELLQESEVYAHYCSNAEMFSSLLRKDIGVLDCTCALTLLKNLLKYSDGKNSRFDYSVFLLLQKPMARIMRYQLFFEALLKANSRNTEISEMLQELKSNLCIIDEKVEVLLKEFQKQSSLDLRIRFEYTKGRDLSFYGVVKLASIANLAWPVYRKSLSMMTTETLALFTNSVIIICEWVPYRSRKKPLLILPYDECCFLTNPDEYDGGITFSRDSSLKIRFYRNDFEFEVVLGFPSEGTLRAALGAIPREIKRQNYGVECNLPDTFAASEISINAGGVDRSKYKLCYFREVFPFEPLRPRARLIRSKLARQIFLLNG